MPSAVTVDTVTLVVIGSGGRVLTSGIILTWAVVYTEVNSCKVKYRFILVYFMSDITPQLELSSSLFHTCVALVIGVLDLLQW